MDFVAIGDTVVDEFIQLKNAHVRCDSNNENCTISLPWGDKIPYESAITVSGVGNAANAAVAAVRLGLTAGFISNIGTDKYGDQVLDALQKNSVDARYIVRHSNIPTNLHYVLMYEGERTILIRHETYPYKMPENFEAPKWIYLSSIAENTESFHDELFAWLNAHKETKLAFQPGTFQIKMGKERLAPLYSVAHIVACNKEEAQRILEVKDTDIKTLLEKMRALGPKIVLITDGPKGAYVSDGNQILKVPMYRDQRPPVDRTGAGDACAATFVVALSLGKSVEEALLWGPINSMSVVQEIGAQKGLLTRTALEQYLKTAPVDYKATVV